MAPPDMDPLPGQEHWAGKIGKNTGEGRSENAESSSVEVDGFGLG